MGKSSIHFCEGKLIFNLRIPSIVRIQFQGPPLDPLVVVPNVVVFEAVRSRPSLEMHGEVFGAKNSVDVGG